MHTFNYSYFHCISALVSGYTGCPTEIATKNQLLLLVSWYSRKHFTTQNLESGDYMVEMSFKYLLVNKNVLIFIFTISVEHIVCPRFVIEDVQQRILYGSQYSYFLRFAMTN